MAEQSANSEPQLFHRFVIFFNPASTHAVAVQRRIKEMQRLAGERPVTIVETSERGRKANIALVEKHAHELDKNTLLCIAAGDGTTNQIIEGLITAKLPKHARHAVVLPLWGGNANDLAHMLNGPAFRARLKDILAYGHVVPIHPLQCDLTARNGRRSTYLAACYASLGITGFVAKRLTQPAYRRSKLHRIPGGTLLKDILTVIGVLMDAPSFGIKEHGDVRSVYELSFYNGCRMAKIERLPAKLTDEMFYLNKFENKRLLSIIPRMIETTRKGVAQNLLRNYTSFTTQEESWAQFDGEPVKVPAHTKVQVQLSPRPFYVLTTSLENPHIKK
jgi:diacylglycerol kinase family enzyme